MGSIFFMTIRLLQNRSFSTARTREVYENLREHAKRPSPERCHSGESMSPYVLVDQEQTNHKTNKAAPPLNVLTAICLRHYASLRMLSSSVIFGTLYALLEALSRRK